MHDLHAAIERVRKYAAEADALKHLVAVIERIGSLENAEAEYSTRIEQLRVDESRLRDSLEKMRKERAEIEAEAKALLSSAQDQIQRMLEEAQDRAQHIIDAANETARKTTEDALSKVKAEEDRLGDLRQEIESAKESLEALEEKLASARAAAARILGDS